MHDNITMDLRMTVGDREVEFFCLDTPESIHISEQILTGKTYPILPYPSKVNMILDIGANLGAASVYFSLFYPDAQIYSVEPQKKPFDILTHNTASNPKNKTFNVGLYDRDTEMPLHLSWADSSTASLGDSWLNTKTTEMIQLRDAAQWVEEQGITQVDILKLDTEGCEVPILSRLTKLIPKIQVIYLEYHTDSDRRAIDQLIGDSHVLAQSRLDVPHRGELVYVRADLGDESSELHKHRIRFKAT